jgi:hypothetical protein
MQVCGHPDACLRREYAVSFCSLLLQGFLVVIPDYFKGNPRTKNDSMDTFPAW